MATGTDVLSARPRPSIVEQPSLFGFDPPGSTPPSAASNAATWVSGPGSTISRGGPGGTRPCSPPWSTPWVGNSTAGPCTTGWSTCPGSPARWPTTKRRRQRRRQRRRAPGRAGPVRGHGRGPEPRYGTVFDRLGFALYRDGRDSVAWHGDQVARDLPEALVATVSLGEPRLFALRPKGGGRAVRYHLGHGDLVVMGGTCQRTWDHAVPKVARAGPRVSVMFRPAWASRFSWRCPALTGRAGST